MLLIAVLSLVAAACSGSTGDAADSATATETVAASGSPATSAPVATGSSAVVNGDGLTLTVVSGWTATALGAGVKPVVALDSSGSPAVAWIFEQIGEGFVAYASAEEGWQQQNVYEGYFYGPIGLAFDPSDSPVIAIHDHQADNFDPALGDLVVLGRDEGGWTANIASDEGHDGWDSTIAIGTDGTVHAAGIDPSQFGSTDGVEYYVGGGGDWDVTAVGSGPIRYQYNVSLALDPDGRPALTYYNDVEGDLVFATQEGDSWMLETVASDGNVGKYSSLAFDDQGRPAITFFEQTGSTTGNIVFAVKEGDSWSVETVGELGAFSDGNARRNSALAFDSEGRAQVAFSDTTGVWYSIRGDFGWETERIVTADLPLGQLVSLVLDGSDAPHLVLYEITSGNPLDGAIAYLTRP